MRVSKQPELETPKHRSAGERANKLWHIRAVEYYTAMKKSSQGQPAPDRAVDLRLSRAEEDRACGSVQEVQGRATRPRVP